MLIYIVSVIILILIFINVFLGEKLYKEPENTYPYFNNVNSINLVKEKHMLASPKYIVKVSILTGMVLGLYIALASVNNVNNWFTFGMAIIILSAYLIELTREITLVDGKIVLSKFLSKTKEIDSRNVTGMYIYSYNKRFLNHNAYTTKLVIVENGKKITKFTLSSLDNKSVLNMMKDSFGIVSNKMYIAKKNIDK